MTALACYRIRPTIGGMPVSAFDDAVDLDRWPGRIVGQFETADDADVPAKLYLVTGANRPPDWFDLLRQGFGDDLQLRRAPAPGALLLVRLRYRRRTSYFAFAFGIGRYLLRDNAYVRNFGLRVALNAIFEGDRGAESFDALRLRSVVARRVSANTMRFQGQAASSAALEDFDVDLDRDLLRGVTGEPVNSDAWGSRVTGSDALHLNVPTSFGDLTAVCQRMVRAHEASDYQARFSWIDDVSRVEDPELVADLEAAVIERLRHRRLEDLMLAVPELVEWERIQRFRLPYDRRKQIRRVELRLEDYISALHQAGRLNGVDPLLLRTHRIDALDAEDNRSYSWSVWRCLNGELQHDQRTFVFDDGDFFEVASDLLADLDSYLERHVPSCNLELPNSELGWDEATYNEVAAESADLVRMDRRLVRAHRSTTPVEVCDLLSTDRHLVHIKRKLGSSVLSHLFAQGLVSADLLLTSEEFRERASERVAEAVAAHRVGVDPANFNLFARGAIDPARFEVVYGVIADWGGRSFVNRLPFFSKLNLRRAVEELRRRGFRATHVCIGDR